MDAWLIAGKCFVRQRTAVPYRSAFPSSNGGSGAHVQGFAGVCCKSWFVALAADTRFGQIIPAHIYSPSLSKDLLKICSASVALRWPKLSNGNNEILINCRAIWLLSHIEEDFTKSSSDFQLNAISWIAVLVSTAEFLNVQEKIDAPLLYQI